MPGGLSSPLPHKENDHIRELLPLRMTIHSAGFSTFSPQSICESYKLQLCLRHRVCDSYAETAFELRIFPCLHFSDIRSLPTDSLYQPGL